jgi:hypothetical protein
MPERGAKGHPCLREGPINRTYHHHHVSEILLTVALITNNLFISYLLQQGAGINVTCHMGFAMNHFNVGRYICYYETFVDEVKYTHVKQYAKIGLCHLCLYM